jgi:carboxymethylenebutenolidase
MMVTFSVGEKQAKGYLATPSSGKGPGVMVLHAWWGLNDFMKSLCDQLAGEGFVAFAPDLVEGRIATTIAEAEALVSSVNEEKSVRPIALAAVDWFGQRPEVQGAQFGVIGFSFGAAWAIVLSSEVPDQIGAVVLYYGVYTTDFNQVQASYLGHFAEADDFEPLDSVREMEAEMQSADLDVTFHVYPGTGHWFFESDRPDAYQPEAAKLAWARTLTFLKQQLSD